MMSYINETDFVIENKKLVYPEIVTDGLQLYYDAKGKRDTDYHRDTMLDMSGNNNHGKLHNFAYEKHSGYKDGLVFDYIDDKLIRPTLNLKPNDFTFMLNGNIISFSPDGTVKRVQDGEVIESKGFNLVRNGDFRDGLAGWSVIAGTLSLTETEYNSFPNSFYKPTPTDALYRDVSLPNNHIIYLSAFVKGTNKMELRMHQYKTWTRIKVVTIESSDEWTLLSLTGLSNNGGIRIDTSVSDGENYYDDFIVIDLTETFGAGNEPTKEQMDEIINRFGYIPNAQDLIDHIEYKGNDLGDMENIIDGLYKTEVLSGEEIYTDKADDNAGVHVEVDGKSYQHAGSGKNLLQTNFVKGHATGSTTFNDVRAYSSDNFNIEPNKTYTLSVTGNTDFNYGYYVSTKLTYPYNGTFRGWYEIGTSRPLTSSTDGILVVMVSKTGDKEFTLEEIRDIKIQLEVGTTATAYEPPAPTPDYPIEIYSLNDFDVVSSVGKENLLPPSDIYILAHNNDGGVDRRSFDIATGIGKLTIGAGRGLSTYNGAGFDRSGLVDGKIYTFSIDVKSDIDRNIFIDWRRGSKAQQIKANEWVRISYSRVFSSTDVSYLWGLTSSTTINQETNVYYRKPKVEEGVTEDTKWTPHLTSVAYDTSNSTTYKINLLLDEPLRSVGNVKDRLFRDSDGVWKIERKVGEYSFTGDEAFTLFENTRTNTQSYVIYPSTNPFFDNLASFTSNTATKNLVSNRFVVRDSTAGDIDFATGYSAGGNKWIWFQVSRSHLTQQNVIGFKEWLTQNPTIITYSINPFIEILSQPLQDKLNNLRSFEDSNYVYTVLPNEDNYLTDNLKPTLHAKFLYNNWYKEDRVINNLMIYNRALTNEEMLQNYKTIKRRWGM